MKTRHLVLIGVTAVLVAGAATAGLAAAFGAFSAPRPTRIATVGGFGAGLGAAAAYLGLSTADLAADLRGGRTLAEVAKARGRSPDGLVDAMIAARTQRLSAAVSAGWLTEDEAKQVESRVRRHVTDLVDNGVGLGF